MSGYFFGGGPPGKARPRPPASTAGRVRMIRLTSRLRWAETAIAIARYVLPVPAGPIPRTMSWGRVAPIYRLSPRPLGAPAPRLGPPDGQHPVTGHQPDVETLLDHSDMLIIPAEKSLDLRPRRERHLSSNRRAFAFHLALDHIPS